MKEIVISLVITIVAVGLVFVFANATQTESIAQDDRFIKTGQIINGYNVYILYDSKTKIQYVFSGKGRF